MPDSAISKGFAGLGTLAAAFAVAGFSACSRHRKAEALPDVAPLRAALQKTANEKLAPPSMAAATIVLTPAGGLYAETIARVRAVARELGGTAIEEAQNGVTRFLAQIPAANVTTFCTRVGGEGSRPVIATSGDASDWIEVTIHKGAE